MSTLSQSPVDLALDSIVSVLEPVWFELVIFAATFVLSWAMKYTATKKKKEIAAAAKEKLFSSGPPGLEKVSAVPCPDIRPQQQRQQQQPRGCSKDAARVPVQMMLKVCEASMRGSSVRSVDQALDIYQQMKLSGYDKRIVELAEGSKFSSLDFYNSLVQCAVRMGKPQLVEELILNMRVTEIPRSRAFYEGTMKILAGKKLFHQALAMHDHMVQDGFEPSAVTCSCLVSFAVEVGDLDRAIANFEKLSLRERPSIRAYMTILRVHSKRHDSARSIAVLEDMQRRGLAPDSLVLNIVLATCLHADRFDQAIQLLEEMLNSTTKSIVDVVSYNTMIKGCAQKGALGQARALLDQMINRRIRPNMITFNTVMDAAMRCKKPAEAWCILRTMEAAGLVPDKYSCSILVKGLQTGNATKEQVRDSLPLLSNMGSHTGMDAKMLEVLFHSVLDASVHLKDHSLTADVLEQMKVQKVSPKASTCSALIKDMSQ